MRAIGGVITALLATVAHGGTQWVGRFDASDPDNTGETAHAGFADFRFVAETADCPE